MKAIDDVACSKPGCGNFGQPGVNIAGHGWFTTKSGRRRRYRCKSCGATLSTNTGTAYSGLRCSRKAFDQGPRPRTMVEFEPRGGKEAHDGRHNSPGRLLLHPGAAESR